MDKGQLLERLRSDLRANDALRAACEAILKYLESQRVENLRHISFGALSRAAGLPSPIDALPAAEYLSSQSVRVLEKCFFLVDGTEEFEIPAETVREATEARVLYHPDTGEAVEDFERHLHLYFVPGQEAQTLLRPAS